MSPAVPWTLGVSASTSAILYGLAVDRMVIELKDTKEIRYANPLAPVEKRGKFGRHYFSSSYSEMYRERFPESLLRFRARALGIVTVALAFAFSMTVHAVTNPDNFKKNEDAHTLQDLGR
jgi:hypothetical protein